MAKKTKGIEQLRSRYGMCFISPWIIGLVLFFILPIAQSIYYSFCSLSMGENGIIAKFIGMANYNEIINVDPNYLETLTNSLVEIMYSLPVIFVISLILAMLLNQQFPGRTFFRALYFLPVVIASGVVISILFEVNTADMTDVGMDEAISANMIDFSEIIKKLDLPTQISKYLTSTLSNMFELVWNSGIQIILFISGMQSIPEMLYEVAKVEGCTKWEEFWFITLPMLSKVSLLVIVFTIVELLVSQQNVMMTYINQKLASFQYGVGSAMAWFYFLIVGIVLGAVMFLLDRFWLKRWR